MTWNNKSKTATAAAAATPPTQPVRESKKDTKKRKAGEAKMAALVDEVGALRAELAALQKVPRRLVTNLKLTSSKLDTSQR